MKGTDDKALKTEEEPAETDEKTADANDSDGKTYHDRETPAYNGLMFGLAAFKDRLSETHGYKLNSRPREVDVRIIDKLGGTGDRMENAIAYLFERHNLVELKNPYEPLNIDVVWKGISYAAQYKSSGYDDTTGGKGVEVIPMKEVTLTVLRLNRPVALFDEMRSSGYGIEQKFPGVYYIKGIADIKIQIVVGIELVGDEFVPLRVQKKNANDEDIRKFTQLAEDFRKKGDTVSADMADAIMQVSISENKEIYERLIEEDKGMCKALRDLFEDDMQKELDSQYQAGARAGANASQEDSAKKMLIDGMSIDNVVKYTTLERDRVNAIAQTVVTTAPAS